MYSGVDTLNTQGAGQSFEEFAGELKRKLESLNTKAKLDARLNSIVDKFIGDSLKGSKNVIVETLEKDLKRNLNKHCTSYVAAEMEHIKSCLDGPNYFNLFGQVVDDATEKLLRKGGKYAPFVKVDCRKRKEQFTTEFCEIINNIIKFIVPPSKQVNLVTLKRYIKRLKKTYPFVGFNKNCTVFCFKPILNILNIDFYTGW